MVILIVILFTLAAGIGLGFMLGISKVMREAATHAHATQRPVFAKLLIGMGGAMLIGALATSLHTWRFTHIALRTGGTVTELLSQTDKDSGSVTYAPTFRFFDANGSPHTVSSSFYSSPPEFHAGDSVTVLYRGDDPQSARIDSYWQVWALPSLLAILGVIATPIGVIMQFWPQITARLKGQVAAAR